MVIKVELSAQQKIVYKGIQDNNMLMADPNNKNSKATSLKNAIMQLRKICNHPYLFEGHEPIGHEISDHIFSVSGKFELLDRMLPKLIITGHKVLIFSQFTQLLDIMKMYFYYRNIPHLILDGRTKDEDRKKCLERFSHPNSEEKVFVLSTKAGGHGLNLQVADTVIIFDSDWNPQMDEQAKDRAHRIGQQSEVRVYRLITATKVEEGILSKATYKKGLDDKIIQAGMFNDNASDLDRQNKL
jgi:SNF2 family DNA or RNA helicase